MNILDKRFKYVPAASTDIRKTFAKFRKLIEEKKREQVVTPFTNQKRNGGRK